jgi:DNA repair photolyase
MLNEVKGNMYDWVTHTWNPVKGVCPHDCTYCYMKKWGIKMKPARLVLSELKTDLGSGNTIFVGSSCDMWASAIPKNAIEMVLNHCQKHPDNTYVFQSKNPNRFSNIMLPQNTMLGTTIESDQWHTAMKFSPTPWVRAESMIWLKEMGQAGFITIEPVMNFHLESFVEMIKAAAPSFVNIGANTNSKIKLEEPSSAKLQAFINELLQFTEIREKSNLKRILSTTE